jgi:hypothetical protein
VSVRAVFEGCLKRSDNILRGNEGLNVVNGSKDKSTAWSQVIDASLDLIGYIFRLDSL